MAKHLFHLPQLSYSQYNITWKGLLSNPHASKAKAYFKTAYISVVSTFINPTLWPGTYNTPSLLLIGLPNE